MKTRDSSRLNGGKLDLPIMEERTVEISRDSEGKESKKMNYLFTATWTCWK
jgi:hypothetical protein